MPIASYEPPTRHVAAEIVERIDETPQQNSKDIEALIEHNHRLHRLKGFASFIVFVVGVVIAAFLINSYVFQSYYVDGTSMTPTLQNNDRLIIDKVERTIAGMQGKPYIPERGQIVVLDSSIVGINGRDEQLIKRVIGLPGDTVLINDGAVTIKNTDNPDGFDVNSKLNLKLQPTYVESPMELTIPDGQVFVMGDNRVENGSYDSRAFGPIEVNKIVGRLWARILPVDKAQVF
jgi:signal peptidase I